MQHTLSLSWFIRTVEKFQISFLFSSISFIKDSAFLWNNLALPQSLEMSSSPLSKRPTSSGSIKS